MATQTHPTSKHLSTQHCEKTAVVWKRYLPGGREGGKTKQQAIYTLCAKHMAFSLNSYWHTPHIRQTAGHHWLDFNSD